MRMNRENVASLVAVVAAVSILIAAWLISGDVPWHAIIAGILGPVFAVLFMKWMKQYQDERFTQIYNLASRNALVFLIFALPYLGAILALQTIAAEAVGPILIVWVLSIIMFYASGFYYYKK
jgi:uncharacterized membrane protein